MSLPKHKTNIQSELVQLHAQLSELGVQNADVSEDWIPTPAEPSDGEPDANDLGDRSEDWQERRGTLDALETRYNNLRRAMKKIEAGTYGTCEICGASITEARLEANPAARTCTEHLEAEEQLTN